MAEELVETAKEFFLPSNRRAAEEPRLEKKEEAPAEAFLPSTRRTPTPPGLMEDVLKTAEAAAPRAAAGTLLGGLGSVETFAAKELPELARAGLEYGKEKLDIISPAERQRTLAQPLYPAATPEQKAGLAAPITGLPTYKGVETEIKKEAGKELPAFLGYEPKTVPGKVTEAGIVGSIQALPGGLPGLGTRALVGAGAGAGGELAGQLFEGHEGEESARLAGALTGALGAGAGSHVLGKVTNAIRSMVSDNAARENIAKAFAADLERGQTAFSPDQIRDAMERGEPISVYDMAGPEGKKLISQYADVSPANRQRAADYNRFLEERRVDAGSRISDYLGDMLGTKVDAATLTNATEKAGAITRNNVYELIKKDPSAAMIRLKDVGGDLVSRPLFKDAMKEAEKTAANNPEWDIKVPSFTPAREEMVGLEKVQRPAKDIAGNLAYWDQVKRELDGKISQAKRSGDTSALASAQSLKKELVGRLDEMVGGYKKARDIASETFEAATAPEAGYDFFGKTNQFKLKDIRDAVGQYSPEQKELFAQGFASRINDEALAGRITSLNNKFTKDKNFQDRVRLALGDDMFSTMKAKVASENLLSKAQEVKFLADKVTPGKAAIGTAATVAATEAAMAGVSPGTIIHAALGAATAAGVKVSLNALEKTIAERALPLALSQDPKDLRAFAKLIEEEPVTNKVLEKLNKAFTIAIPQYEKAHEESSQPERQGRASGGRICVTAETLMRMAERSKKKIQNKTETILNQPDEHVVRALKIANGSINNDQ